MTRNFIQMLEAKWAEGKFVCVGLDPDLDRLPADLRERDGDADAVKAFCLRIVEATHDLACAFKPNIAFFQAVGFMGMETLQETVLEIRRLAPDMPVILDAKVADIGNTNLGYVKTAFDYIEADAITVHPYLGQEAMKPFLDRKDKGVIVLCRTSNPGAGEFQDLPIMLGPEFREKLERAFGREIPESSVPLYQYLAYRVSRGWNANGNCCLVTGATYPEELAQVRKIVGDMPLLIPGVGKQGGDVNAVVKAAGGKRMIINSSSGIIFAEDPRQATRELNKQIDLARL